MTGAAALALLGLAAVLVRSPSPATARLRLLQDGSRRVRPGLPRVAVGLAAPTVVGAATLAAWAWLGFGVTLPLLPAVAGGIAGVTAALVASGAAADRRRGRAAAALVESVGILAGELRAGQAPADALAILGADPRSEPVTRHRAVSAVWTVAERSGAPAAAVLERVEQDLREREQQRREIAAQLAGARSTAGLLAVLPVLGIGLGVAMGADPLRTLLGNPRGQIALVVGAALQAAGVLWTARIVRSAGEAR